MRKLWIKSDYGFNAWSRSRGACFRGSGISVLRAGIWVCGCSTSCLGIRCKALGPKKLHPYSDVRLRGPGIGAWGLQ